MPTYQYTCTDCGEELEVQQSFSDDSLTTCPVCEGRLRKVFNAVGVVFKGSGFYRNDSRGPNGEGPGKQSGGEGGGKESAEGGEGKESAAKQSSGKAAGSVGDKSGATGAGKNGANGGGTGSSGSGASASSPAAVGAGPN